MPYPTLEQYNLAFQLHAKLLTDPELKAGTLAKSGLGLPLAISGGFALTYTITAGRKKYAVRCFHRESKALERRYAAISKRLNGLQSPYFLAFEFQPQGIKVDGAACPIVKMAWAEGETLGEFLEANHKNVGALAKLSDALGTMAQYLEAQHIAHGDLQPGNIMVSGGGSVVQLIDYDGMFVDDIKDLGSSELGHVNFQHPQRKSTNPFDAHLDRFSFTSLCLSLKALRTDASIWGKTNSEVDAIVFRANDFADPGSSAAFALLSANGTLAAETKNFAAVCKSPMANAPTSLDFFVGRNIPAVSIVLGGPAKATVATTGYIGAYSVLSALDYAACLRSVGDKVEVIGQIVEVKADKSRSGKPYIFINFGAWKGNIFKVSLWSEGLAVVTPKPTASWVGQWVSVVGLMEPPFVSRKYKYSHLSISVTAANQLTRISEVEAKRRLAGGSQVPFKAAENKDLLEKIRGKSQPSYVPPTSNPRPTQPTSRAPASPPLTANQAALIAIKGTTSPTQAVPPYVPSHRSASQAPSYTPPPPTPVPGKRPSSWGWPAIWAVGIWVVIVLANPTSKAPVASSPSIASTTPAPLAVPKPAVVAPVVPTEEIVPPLRRTRALTVPELRYCAAQAIRLSAGHGEARQGDVGDTRQLANMTTDFNHRCRGYQKAGPDFGLVTSQVEPRRSDLEKEGRIQWFSTMQARIQAAEAAASAASAASAAALAAQAAFEPQSLASPPPLSVSTPVSIPVAIPAPQSPPAQNPSRSGMPDNASLDFTGHAWTCNRGFVQVGYQCAAVQMPENAQLDFTGHGWVCRRGYVGMNGSCVPVQMPPNAQIDYTGHGWVCSRGFVANGGGCAPVAMPANAQLDYSGHAWTCIRGYVGIGAECLPIQMPANSQLDYTGHAWTCARSYYQAGLECVPGQVPQNGTLDYTGHGWACQRGYQRVGNQCLRV